MKKDKTNKKFLKNENKFKSKFESLKKLPDSISTTNALEKARAFFRSFNFRRHNNRNRNEQLSSSSSTHQDTTITTTLPSFSSSNSIIINKNDSIISSTNINNTNENINSNDMIIYQSIQKNQYNDKSSNYFHQKYKQILKPTLLLPKQYYNDILNKNNTNYFTSINKYNSYSRPIVSNINPNLIYSNHIYPPFNISNDKIPSYYTSTSWYNNRNNEQYTIKRPLLSSTISSWNQCVRRLNTEYRMTINALQQTKEYLEQANLKSTKYVNLVPYNNINNLSNNEIKKSSNVTFSFPISNKISSSLLTNHIEQYKILPSIKFSKPKLVKPIQLDTFNSSLKLKPIISNIENNENLDSITNTIKKFNDLSRSLSSQINTNKLINYQTYNINSKSTSPEISLINNEEQSQKCLQEETTYTIDTLYKNTDDDTNNLSSNHQDIIIIRENTTKEKFNLFHEELETNRISPQNTSLISQTNLSSLSNKNCRSMESSSSSSTTSIVLLDNNNNKSSTSSTISLKDTNQSISHKLKSSTTNISRLKQPSKIISSSTITNNTLRKPTRIINNKTQSQSSSIIKKQSSNNVNKSHQNRTDSTSLRSTGSSSTLTKRSYRSTSNQSTISTNKNNILRK